MIRGRSRREPAPELVRVQAHSAGLVRQVVRHSSLHQGDLAGDQLGDPARQGAVVGDILAVDLQHHVADLEAGGLRRAARRHHGDEGALRVLQADRLGGVVVDRLDLHA